MFDIVGILLRYIKTEWDEGFIRTKFYNTFTQKNFAKNIPVAF